MFDEGASLADVVPAVASAWKGRGVGVGIVFTVLGVTSLTTAFGDKPARVLLSELTNLPAPDAVMFLGVQELLASLDARIERMKTGTVKEAGVRSDALAAAKILKQQVTLVGRDNWGLILDTKKLAAEWDRAATGHADTAGP